MAIYSISDLEKLSGIKAHTIRVWEQRYSIIKPSRTPTNIRYYTESDLKSILNISTLYRQGLKIGKIAKLSPKEIAERVAEISQNSSEQPAQIDALTLAMIDFDEVAFDRIFSSYTWEKGFENTLIELIYPFLDKLNVLWLTGSVSPAHEKFISSLIRRKIMVAIDKEQIVPAKDALTFILYMPKGETHELTLLFIHYLLRYRKYRVVYLGLNVTLDDLQQACEAVRPHYIFSIINEPLYRQSLQSYCDDLSGAINGSTAFLTGQQVFVQQAEFQKNIKVLGGLDDTLQLLDKIKLGKVPT